MRPAKLLAAECLGCLGSGESAADDDKGVLA